MVHLYNGLLSSIKNNEFMKLLGKWIEFAKHKKTKKKEVQHMDTSFLLRIGYKIPMKGVTETKFGAETKGWTI